MPIFTAATLTLRAAMLNGLNQYVSTSSGAAFCYDGNDNLKADETNVFLYDIENRLVAARAQESGNGNCAALLYTLARCGRCCAMMGTSWSRNMTAWGRSCGATRTG